MIRVSLIYVITPPESSRNKFLKMMSFFIDDADATSSMIETPTSIDECFPGILPIPRTAAWHEAFHAICFDIDAAPIPLKSHY